MALGYWKRLSLRGGTPLGDSIKHLPILQILDVHFLSFKKVNKSQLNLQQNYLVIVLLPQCAHFCFFHILL